MEQLKRNRFSLAVIYGSGCAVIATVWAVGMKVPGTIDLVMRDPAQAADVPFYTGLVSNLGVLFWSVAAAVCLFSWGVLRRVGAPPSGWSYFFGFAGGVTSMLLLDDLFLVHDEIVPKWLFPKKGPIHLNEKVVLAIYALVTLRFLWNCRETILRRTDWGLLALTFTLLVLSVVSERGFVKAFIATAELRRLTEDSFKLLGIMGWCHYFTATALAVLSRSLAGPGRVAEQKSSRQNPADNVLEV